MLDITRLLQPCVDNLVTSLLYHGYNNLVTRLIMPSSLLQVVNLVSNLLQQTGNKPCEHNLLTACEQTCNNLFADLLQLVRFYVCRRVSRQIHVIYVNYTMSL